MGRPFIMGLILGEADVTPLQYFTMLDAQDYIRYNVHDWLSLSANSVHLHSGSLASART